MPQQAKRFLGGHDANQDDHGYGEPECKLSLIVFYGALNRTSEAVELMKLIDRCFIDFPR
ncbi:MAG: hypothetical protein EB072_07350 [Betaproteobacteria bacterium]|nr:hypothetical protein [Betaproteobacteria bacterium]